MRIEDGAAEVAGKGRAELGDRPCRRWLGKAGIVLWEFLELVRRGFVVGRVKFAALLAAAGRLQREHKRAKD